MKVGDKVQLRRRISQKGGKTRLATEKVTILGIYPASIQVRNQKGIGEELYKLGVAAVDQQRRNGRRRIMAQEWVNND